MMQRDFYQVLGIARVSSPTEIRMAYVRLARHYHPDHIDGTRNLPQRLQDVQQAYRCLSDTDLRARHDRAIQNAERAYFVRQRGIQRRLRRYDRHHPHSKTRSSRRKRWRALLLVAMGTAIIVHVSYGLIT